MKIILSNQFLLLLARYVIGTVFIYAGIEKIADPVFFSDSISNYKILPEAAVNFFAITLPWIEVVAGIFLIFGVAVKENAFIINAMLIVFVVAIVISLARGLNIDCGCFGREGGSELGFLKVVENMLLLSLGMLLIFFDSKMLALNSKEHSA